VRAPPSGGRRPARSSRPAAPGAMPSLSLFALLPSLFFAPNQHHPLILPPNTHTNCKTLNSPRKRHSPCAALPGPWRRPAGERIHRAHKDGLCVRVQANAGRGAEDGGTFLTRRLARPRPAPPAARVRMHMRLSLTLSKSLALSPNNGALSLGAPAAGEHHPTRGFTQLSLSRSQQRSRHTPKTRTRARTHTLISFPYSSSAATLPTGPADAGLRSPPPS